MATLKVKKKQRRRQRKRKLKRLRQRLEEAKSLTEKRKIIDKIHRISPRAPVPEA
jgi:hypothetical protein